MNPNQIIERDIEKIDAIIRIVCRRRSIKGELERDFRSFVYEKLLEQDAKRVRSYQGDDGTTWRGYLSIVINRLAIDFTKKHWGRWENSVIARSMGEAAIHFETLLHRDEYSFEAAVQLMMQIPLYQKLYCLSERCFDSLSRELPKPELEKIKLIPRNRYFTKPEVVSVLSEIIDKNETKLIRKTLQLIEVRLCEDLLAEWELVFQHRIPTRQSSFLGALARAEQPGHPDEVVANRPANEKHSPLERLINRELAEHLETFLDRIIDEMDEQDLFILSLYLIDNLRISEIVRMTDSGKSTDPFGKHRNAVRQTVTTKDWKYVKKRISVFFDKIHKKLPGFSIGEEEREWFSHHCVSLLSKKMLEKMNNRRPS